MKTIDELIRINRDFFDDRSHLRVIWKGSVANLKPGSSLPEA